VLELLWARQQIGILSDKEACDSQAGFAEEITRLGLAHGLLTKYTSFVAVDRVARPSPEANATAATSGAAPASTPGGNVPATPEPATWGMIGLTVLALAWFAWRRQATTHGKPRADVA
jgi:Ca-activated chloride channel family protein